MLVLSVLYLLVFVVSSVQIVTKVSSIQSFHILLSHITITTSFALSYLSHPSPIPITQPTPIPIPPITHPSSHCSFPSFPFSFPPPPPHPHSLTSSHPFPSNPTQPKPTHQHTNPRRYRIIININL